MMSLHGLLLRKRIRLLNLFGCSIYHIFLPLLLAALSGNVLTPIFQNYFVFLTV